MRARLFCAYFKLLDVYVRVFVCLCVCWGGGGGGKGSELIIFSVLGLTCKCSGLFCPKTPPNATHCVVSDGGYCLVRQHTYLGETGFDHQCVEAPPTSMNPALFLVCSRGDHCIENNLIEIGCFCCKGDNCNTEEFYYAKQGWPSTSLPVPQPTPVSSDPTSPTLGKLHSQILVCIVCALTVRICYCTGHMHNERERGTGGTLRGGREGREG